MKKTDIFFERLDRKIVEHGLSYRGLSMKVTGTPDLIRDARRNSSIPKSDNLAKIASILEVSTDWLMGADLIDIRSDARVKDEPVDYSSIPPREDLPVLGTAHGGTLVADDQDNDTEIEKTQFEPTTVIRYVLRPRALADATDAYAVYVEGDSMYPRFAPGEMAVIDPRLPPKIGDDVIVQLSDNGDDEITTILVKRLVRRSSSYVELEQFNPGTTFRIKSERVRRMHRIFTQGDLLGG